MTNESIIEKEGRRILKRFKGAKNPRETIALAALLLILLSVVCDAGTKGFLDERSDSRTTHGFSELEAGINEL